MIRRLINFAKSSLSVKICAGIFIILFTVCLLIFCFLWLFIPRNYKKETDLQTEANFKRLAEQIKETDIESWEGQLVAYCIENKSAATIEDVNINNAVNIAIAVNGQSKNTNISTYVSEITKEGQNYVLVSYVVSTVDDQISEFFSKVFPYVIGVIIIVSALTALFYSRALAKPVIEISRVSKSMAELDTAWRCDIKRTDEIGILADSLNKMASKLDEALNGLHNANEKLRQDIDKERKQDMQRRNLFIAVSHELKTPLTILKCYLDGMINNLGRYKDRDKYLQQAFQTAEEMEKLIKEILIVSKMESANFQLNFSDVDMTDVIKKLYGVYYTLAKSTATTVNISCDEDLHCMADKAYIENAVSNIISNALNHSPEGETVNIELKRLDGIGVLTVENSGVHINQNDLEQIFLPFYRTDKSRSRHTGGSGLGLYIVKGILDSHQFYFNMYNTTTGICFMIKFPLL